MTRKSPWDDVTVVIVVHNSESVISAALQRVKQARRVIVVDNASHDDTCDAARRALPTVEIHKMDTNLGYGRANNRGFALAATEFVLLLNPDALVEEGALETLVAAADRYLEAAVLAPLLYTPEGRLEFYTMGFDAYAPNEETAPPDGDVCTGFIMGASMLWRLSAWHDIGGFDENFFIYGEDVDISRRTVQAGYGIVIVPSAIVRHLSGKSSPVTWRTRWRKDWHVSWGRLYNIGKHDDADKAVRCARHQLWLFGFRALMYTPLFRFKKVMRNLAAAGASLQYLLHRPTVS